MVTRESSLLKLLKFRGSIGTGFAHAINTLPVARMENNGTMIDPKRSIWGIGFNVSLPMSLAVVSPHRNATHP